MMDSIDEHRHTVQFTSGNLSGGESGHKYPDSFTGDQGLERARQRQVVAIERLMRSQIVLKEILLKSKKRKI